MGYPQSTATYTAAGAVTYSLASGSLPTGLSLTSAGVITGTAAGGTVGTYNFTVRATNPFGNGPATGTQTLTVAKGATTTSTPTSSSNPSTVNTPVTYYTTVATGSVTPTGTVEFYDNSVGIAGCTSVALTGSSSPYSASCTTSPASTGTHPITASFLGDSNYSMSTSPGTLNQLVNPPAPTVTGVAPSDGPTSGGTVVVITGTDFTGVSAVNFGGTAAAAYTVDSPTQITATTAAASAGTVDVMVTAVGGTSAANPPNDQFTYVNAPTVTGVAPSDGPTSGGTVVVITGTDFTGVSAVNFGGTAAAAYTVDSPTQITATTAAASAGTVDVMVTAVGGTSAANPPNDQFTYVNAPTVTGVAPSDGPTSGGTVVVITGTDFTGVSAVNFGGTAAAAYTVDSPTQITATTAAASAGTVDVMVTAVGGTSAANPPNDQFTYVNAPTVTGVAPSDGPTSGGTVVVITGTDFTGVSAVNFGGTAAAAYTVDSPTQITATTAAASAGTVDVMVTAVGGTSAANPPNDQFTYVNAPTVTGVAPSDGPTSGGTVVVITGTDFTGVSAVNFGGTAAAAYTVDSPTQITATTAAASAGTVDVMVTAVGGTSAANPPNDQFTYVNAPTVTGVAPSDGPTSGGTVVVITGTDFTGVSAVNFGGTAAAAYTVDSPTQITATTAAASAGTVDVMVTAVGGTSAANPPNDQFTYVNAPTVTGVAPSDGPTSGGTVVVITGTDFTGVSAVNFGGTAAAAYTVDSPTQITATTAAASAGTVDVMVTAVGGTSAANPPNDQFTYVNAPTVTGVAPSDGPTSGGTVVVITGTDFTGVSAVNFGGTAAAAYTVDSPTQITATTAAASAGTVDVMVTAVGGTSAANPPNDQFTYVNAPTVTGVAPSDGPTSGGTVVVITGTDFTGVSAVNFGGTAAAAYTVDSPTQITATTAAASAGTVDVMVTAVGGTSAANPPNDQFTYVNAPTVTGVAPSDGPTSGGTVVVITGTDFTGVSAVNFGGTAAAAYTVDSPTQITATTAAASAGTVDVMVTAVGGTSAANPPNDQFTYVNAPTVTGVAPSDGPTSGGTVVVITGTDFTGVSAVNFGGTAAAAYTVDSPTQITATTAAASAGTVDVMVTAVGGTSAANPPNDQFTYVNAPTVTGVAPSDGPTSGGTVVVITGTDFTGVSAVNFGGTAAAAYTVDSPTQITATTAAASAGTVDVMVTAVGGTSAANPPNDQFTYVNAPTVTGVNPNAGPVAGGTVVVITGTDFTGVSAVNFGGTAAAVYHVDSPTQITATTAAASAGTVDVMVTAVGGTSAANPPNDRFTYAAVPVITGISPNAGPASGGTVVVITGSGFLPDRPRRSGRRPSPAAPTPRAPS